MGYTKQNFKPGDVLKASQLNAMDEQIAANESAVAILSGTYEDAVLLSQKKNTIFTYLLNDYGIKKPIWHIGGGVFIDAVGATIEFEIDEPSEPDTPVEPENPDEPEPDEPSGETPTFKFTVMLDEDNATVYVPIVAGTKYNMTVDWGDGSEIETYNQTGAAKTLSHSYTGVVGDKYQISLFGEVPSLRFASGTYGNVLHLYSIDDNTLTSPLSYGNSGVIDFYGCNNLTSICANAFQNCENINKLTFRTCSSLTTLPVGLLEPFDSTLTSLNSFVMGCTNITLSEEFLAELSSKLSSVTNIGSMFSGVENEIVIPNNFLDNLTDNSVTNVASAFSSKGVRGDAKALYDVLKLKVTEDATTTNCFSGTNMINRDQVPTTWGGKLSE